MAGNLHAIVDLFVKQLLQITINITVMKKIILFLLVFIALSANSQIIDIEPSWELNPTGDPPCDDVEKVVASLLEMNNGDFVVSIVPLYPDGDAKLVMFDQYGGILQETILPYDENYEVATILLDEWNGTMNAFMILCNMTENNAVIMHSYIFEDATTSEPKEIWRKEFTETRDLRVYSDRILIDKNGCRTFMFEFSEYPSVPPVDYYPIILKIDANLNVISEKEYESEELNNDNMPYCCFTYSADSTQYYYVSYNRTEHPYGYFMNVFDMDLNLTEQIPFVSDPPIDLQSFGGNWSQNPYDGKIYGLGNKYDIYTLKDRCAFKIDVENNKVNCLRLTTTPEDVRVDNAVGTNLCFMPNGDIIGQAAYNTDLWFQFKPDGYWIYMPVFDSNMKKKSEWYYTMGINYNQHIFNIYPTKDDGVILLGRIRFEMGGDLFWEPYIVKFPASAFNPDNIEEAHAHGLHLAVAYPNPGGDVMNIRTGLRNAVLSVYDINGRKIHEQEITDDVTSVNASKWQSGTYVWELKTENGKLKIEEGKWVK